MKKKYLNYLVIALVLLIQENVKAQCGTNTLVGSSSNLFTLIRNSTNPIAADKVLNTIVYIHRNNAGVFIGNSGHLRYDISVNGGTSWTLNQGFLNPINSSLARYPNVTIYNPTNNINPANAYLGYMAATINSVNSAWNGVVTGVMQLNLTGQTENYNQPIVNPQLIAHSVVKGAPGVFWAVDALYNGINITGFNVYKGTWNGTNDIVWTNNFSVNPPFNIGFNGTPQVGDYNIAFDPSGTVGWFSFLGHVSPGPGNYAFYPVLYKTTNGGTSWTGPFQVDLTAFGCVTANIVPPNVPSTNFEHDLTVDMNGNPHILTTLCNGTNVYSVLYGSWHHMFDITLVNGVWAAHDLGNVNAGRGTWGVAPNAASQDMSPQISRNVSGSKIFYSWTDNSGYALGAANLTPNLFSRAYDVPTNKLTPLKDFTSCNFSIAGKILFPHVAAEVLEPNPSTYKLAPVYGEFVVPADPLQTTNFNFIDNATYANADFSITVPTATLSFAQGASLLICPNSTLGLSLSGSPGQLLWSTGAATPTLPVTTSTVISYSVTAQLNCLVGTASISVTNLSVSASAPNVSVCPGNSLALSVTGNANGYTWTPGGQTGTNAVVVVSTTPVYTVTAGGSSGCLTTNTVAVNILQTPTISITGNNTICLGTNAIETASGASTYLWSDGTNGSVATLSPTLNTVYTVTGTAVNSCTNTQTVSIFVNPNPTVTAISSQSAICFGETVTLTASGASTYSWLTLGGTPSIAPSPTITTTYSVTGSDTNLCTTTQTVLVTVNPLPAMTATSTRSLFCKGEKSVILSVTGANSYTWSLNNSNASSITITPNATVTYTIRGLSAAGCANTTTLTQFYSTCAGINVIKTNEDFLQIFPNPNNGEFKLKAGTEVNLVIVNELGQIIKSAELGAGNDYEITINDFPSGIYLVSCQNKEALLVRKLIINR